MRRKRFWAVMLATLLALLCCSCAKEEQPFEGFPEPFEANVEGEWNGVALAATVKADRAAPDGTRQITMTFYAPDALCGTTLCRRTDGSFFGSVGEWQLPLGADLAPLFDLFSADIAPKKVSLTEQGLTAVETEAARYLFLPDNTLYRIEASQGALNVISTTCGE